MKVTYEFDVDDKEKNDKYELDLVQNARHFYNALMDIQDMVRCMEKGYQEYNQERIISDLREALYESNIDMIH